MVVEAFAIDDIEAANPHILLCNRDLIKDSLGVMLLHNRSVMLEVENVRRCLIMFAVDIQP